VCSQVADGEDSLQIWEVAVNILNMQSQTAENMWSSSLGVGQGANYSPQNTNLLQNAKQGL